MGRLQSWTPPLRGAVHTWSTLHIRSGLGSVSSSQTLLLLISSTWCHKAFQWFPKNAPTGEGGSEAHHKLVAGLLQC